MSASYLARSAKMRRVQRLAARFALVFTMFAPAGHAALPTPEITHAEDVGVPGHAAYLMLVRLGDTEESLGMGLACEQQGLEAVLYFGAFPPDQRPLQLAVRGADLLIERFDDLLLVLPESGMHIPSLSAGEAARFIRAALQPGALVSNGYRSFWNRLSPSKNEEIRNALASCFPRAS